MKGLAVLAEFAITPEVFEPPVDQSERQAWLRCLDRLADCLFPHTGARPIVVSDMCEPHWWNEVRGILEKSPVAPTDFLKMLGEIAIRRSQVNEHWPATEIDWLNEAISLASKKDVTIDRVIGTGRNYKPHDVKCSPQSRVLRVLCEVLDRGFWQGICATRSLAMKLDDQVSCLLALSEKFDWIAVYSPQIKHLDWNGSEGLLIAKLIEKIGQLPSSGSRLVIVNSQQFNCLKPHDCLKQVHADITRRAHSLPVISVAWEKLLDRLVFAGDFACTEKGRQLKPLCGISVCHFFSKRDKNADLAPTTWSLLEKSQVSELWSKYDPFAQKVRNHTKREAWKGFRDEEFGYCYH